MREIEILNHSEVEVQMADIKALEHPTLKVPYEVLNKKFRAAQKNIDREASHVQSAVSEIEKGVAKRSPTVGELNEILGGVVEKLNILKRKAEESINEELQAAHVCKRRLDHLKEHSTTNDNAIAQWKKKRLDRMLVEHFLRSGYYNTALKLAKHSNIEDLTNIELFLVSKEVEESLADKDTSKCLNWCYDNKSKLRKLKSSLEFNLRQQEFIELVRKDHRIDAVNVEYNQRAMIIESVHAGRLMTEIIRFFGCLRLTVYDVVTKYNESEKSNKDFTTPMRKIHSKVQVVRMPKIIQRTLELTFENSGCVGGIFALANPLGEPLCNLHKLFLEGKLQEAQSLQLRLISPNIYIEEMLLNQHIKQLPLENSEKIGYILSISLNFTELLEESRWDTLVQQFRQENFKLYQLSNFSVFSVALQAGLSALKTPHCYKPEGERNSDCPICSPSLNVLAQSLPYAHCSQSRLVCYISGQPLNEHNHPLMLPNGYVYGEASTKQMAAEHNGKVICPRTKEVFDIKEAEKVFVM
ncbi:macrophage erythroblast attacher-like [Centruroides sculpturatus]|uniref:macrophage erythroblast attacher-like n=1 Tax=Centruroides sculpturatus TaxID=218467 RepID=UPI000C6D61C4|nr:macrophage erythroblast attacher-like [Centruroides sculpturatus]